MNPKTGKLEKLNVCLDPKTGMMVRAIAEELATIETPKEMPNKVEHVSGAPVPPALAMEALFRHQTLLRPNGEPVPPHWVIFKVGEIVTLKNQTFKIGYLNEETLVLEPVSLVIKPPKNNEDSPISSP